MPHFKLSDLAKLNLSLAGVVTIFILGIAVIFLLAGYPLKVKEVIEGVLGLVLGMTFILILILALDEAPNPSKPRIRRGELHSSQRR